MSTVYRYFAEPTVSSGYWAGETLNVIGDMCTQILIEPTQDTTEFDFIMTDRNGAVVQCFEDEVGTLNDMTPFAANGEYTLEIENASRDEAFKVTICFLER